MFNNTDYPALIIAVVALISPVIVEIIRQYWEDKRFNRDRTERDKEMMSINKGVLREKKNTSREDWNDKRRKSKKVILNVVLNNVT